MRFAKAYGIILCCIGLYADNCIAQAGGTAYDQYQLRAQEMEHAHPLKKVALREEVDTKRWGVNENSDDALPRSREFKRIDSSYYVGWMFEGIYKYNHAADYIGFKNASVPLQNALNDMERDYSRMLSTRTTELVKILAAIKFHQDYARIAYTLANCYSNMNDPEAVFVLLRRAQKWNFQRDIFDVYDWMAWTVHRNRFYTSEKYLFLKNSINENEKLANTYLDSQIRKIDRNVPLNSKLWTGYDGSEDKMSVYHYKNILYSYAFNIDSAQHYFMLMKSSPIFPHNNYATFRAVCGDFKTAEAEYKLAIAQDNTADHRLKEWAYYRSILDIYKSHPKAGATLMQDMIRANGTTPGYGWYNIALARCMVYDGQSTEAEKYTNKAAEFKELHIGTTLGQAHYDFSVQLLKLMNKLHAQEAQKFENRNWWYNPYVLGKISQLTADKYMQQFLIINQFAQNPERDRVIYKLFSTESTVTWDEIWYLISDFSTQYFLDRFSKEVQADPRKNITKYFKFFVAKLHMKQGDHGLAKNELDEILRDPNVDLDYEKLFLARVYEAEAACAKKRKDDDGYNAWMYKLYQTYPELVPYTGMQMNMVLRVTGETDEKVLNRLKDCNVKWVGDNATAPEAFVSFSRGTDKKRRIQFYVRDRNGNTIVEQQSFSYTDSDKDVGVLLAYRLFNIGAKISEQEAQKAAL